MLRGAALGLIFALVPSVGPAHAGPESTLGDDFLWGVASSGFQAEGYSPDSNWRRFSDSGQAEDTIGNSVDFLHRYKDDIKLAKKMGVEVYRVGVEWARKVGDTARYARAAGEDASSVSFVTGIRAWF